ncbi:histidine phosphatase family protein, partial [Thermodesulfobacteriota bacterium]
WAGHSNPPLTELGRQQAQSGCEKFKKMGFSSATSSFLQCALETELRAQKVI